jgi:hypothetical protein
MQFNVSIQNYQIILHKLVSMWHLNQVCTHMVTLTQWISNRALSKSQSHYLYILHDLIDIVCLRWIYKKITFSQIMFWFWVLNSELDIYDISSLGHLTVFTLSNVIIFENKVHHHINCFLITSQFTMKLYEIMFN